MGINKIKQFDVEYKINTNVKTMLRTKRAVSPSLLSRFGTPGLMSGPTNLTAPQCLGGQTETTFAAAAALERSPGLVALHPLELWTTRRNSSPVKSSAMAGPPVLIWEDEVRSLLHYRELVPRVEEALGKFSTRDPAEVVQPVRGSVPLRKHNG